MFKYDNIGRKIKNLAKVIFIIETIAAIVFGIVLAATNDDMLIGGLLLVIAGPVAAWISSFILYGFGQLVENSDIIAESYKRTNKQYDRKIDEKNKRKEKKRNEEIAKIINNADVGDDEFIDIICPHCKAELSFTKSQLNSSEEFICPMCDAAISFSFANNK